MTGHAIAAGIETVSDNVLNNSNLTKKTVVPSLVFSEFRELFKDIACNLKGKRILIIVDELDRCKPLFAIQTLEVIKHLFDVPNVNFLLSVNFQQLKYSIETVYGQKMDSEGYLRRFINYVIKLPEPSKDVYIDYLLKEYPLYIAEEGKNYEDFKRDLKTILKYNSISASRDILQMSLRDINAIYENYRIFFNAKFSDKIDPVLSLPYLILIMLKYKEPDTYQKITDPARSIKNEALGVINDIGYSYNGQSLTRSKSVEKYGFGNSIALVTDSLCSKEKISISGNFANKNGIAATDYNKSISLGIRRLQINEFVYLTNAAIAEIAGLYPDWTIAQYYALQLETFTTNIESTENEE